MVSVSTHVPRLEAEEHTVRPEACEHCCGSDLEIVDEVLESPRGASQDRPLPLLCPGGSCELMQ